MNIDKDDVIFQTLVESMEKVCQVKVGMKRSALTDEIEGALLWGGFIYKFDATPMVKKLRENNGDIVFEEFENWVHHKVYLLAKGIGESDDPAPKLVLV